MMFMQACDKNVRRRCKTGRFELLCSCLSQPAGIECMCRLAGKHLSQYWGNKIFPRSIIFGLIALYFSITSRIMLRCMIKSYKGITSCREDSSLRVKKQNEEFVQIACLPEKKISGVLRGKWCLCLSRAQNSLGRRRRISRYGRSKRT